MYLTITLKKATVVLFPFWVVFRKINTVWTKPVRTKFHHYPVHCRVIPHTNLASPQTFFFVFRRICESEEYGARTRTWGKNEREAGDKVKMEEAHFSYIHPSPLPLLW